MRSLTFIGAIAIAVGIAAGVFFFGGYYSVAGTQAEPSLVAWALIHVRQASIDRHATEMPTVPLDAATLVQEGARVFADRGCVYCHGAPGAQWAKFSEGMHPDPPDLKEIAPRREPRELFWVIKNGINMTGMPGFGPIGTTDKDIWAVVAFIKKLPVVSEADYKSWTTVAAKPGG